MERTEAKVKSLQKALEILNCFTKKATLGVTEISEAMGLNKSNVHNILSTFKAMDYLEQDPESGKYRLGVGIFSLCRALGDNFTIKQVAMPYLQELSNAINERVYLGIPSGGEVIYLEAMHPAESVNLMRSIMGENAKMYCTGIGKAMLAFLPVDEREKYVAEDLTAYTENTIVDRDALRRELALIRRRGYAVDNMEHEYGIKCVAMPIFNKQKKVEAAVSVSGPSLRFEERRIEEILVHLQRAVEKIEQRL